ncbi:MBOAT, membrane-bound O-acyltransferase family-domain-containing protein [Mycena alexandri]|uniref:O-acyltransferase n=1 Tax=Mycena alexandri TaxID=1745969 RepID=A0AAD6TEK6_9AGAR|nr:MBOAT, membrane-bound O-acyltransferase family-domain-containing protein [Mycena alexandri]
MSHSGPAMTTRTDSGGFSTSEGTIYVSKPFRSKSSKKLRAMITFAPRQSTFDINNEASGANEFRGFFTLFWISMFIFTLSTYIRSIETSGHALNLKFATMFSRDAITLAISDAVLVSTTALCVPFAKAVSKGWIRYYWTGLIIQHLLQTTALVCAISWTFNRQWPWVQSGFFTLHTLVMIMKVHSYMTINGHLQRVSEMSQELLDKLRKATDSVGGWEQAVRDAETHRAEVDALTTRGTEDSTPTPSETPMVREGSTTSYVDVPTAAALRQRLVAVSQASDKAQSKDAPVSPATPHVLVDHPNESISAMARDYSELEGELSSSGPYKVTYPNNLTMKNFAVYQLIPTLVYELEYPRTDRIRPIYVFEKTVATFGTFVLLYTMTESFILPHTPSAGDSFFRALLDLSLPFMMAYLLLFYIIFECICNGFAELSYFADRQFYEDWWNSTSWDEFSRKWNKPVHTFLLHHVYASTMASYQLSRTSAMFVTFLLSACVHELVMVVVTKKFRFYIFLMQLIQIPLIVVSRLPAIKRNKLMGNVVFWLGLYAGFPLLCVAYVAY